MKVTVTFTCSLVPETITPPKASLQGVTPLQMNSAFSVLPRQRANTYKPLYEPIQQNKELKNVSNYFLLNLTTISNAILMKKNSCIHSLLVIQ